MESLQDMLLEHVVPDQTGDLGKIHYSFTEMKIVHVHWPKVSSGDGIFVARNGALRLQGKYQLRRPGMFGYTKNGEFIFDLSAICLSIKENKSGTPNASPRHAHHSHHDNHRHHNTTLHPYDNSHRQLREVTCTVGHIKVKFHGGAAMICQFLTSLYIKMYRRHLEAQIASVIQETLKEDQQVLFSALTVMAAMNGDACSASPSTSPSRRHPTHHHDHGETATEYSPSRMQRFFDSFRRRNSAHS